MRQKKKVSIILILILISTTITLGCTQNNTTPEPNNETDNPANETENGSDSADFLKIKEYNVTEGDYFKYRAVERKSGTVKNGRFTVSIHNVTNSTYEIHIMGYGELFSMGSPKVRQKNISDPVFRADIIERGTFNGKQNITISNDTITLNSYTMKFENEEIKSVTTALFHPEIKIPILYYVENSEGKRLDVEMTETNLEALNQTVN